MNFLRIFVLILLGFSFSSFSQEYALPPIEYQKVKKKIRKKKNKRPAKKQKLFSIEKSKKQHTHGLSTTAFFLGLLGSMAFIVYFLFGGHLLLLAALFAGIAIILGIVSYRMNRDNYALAGMVLGIITLGLVAVFLGLIFLLYGAII